MAAVLTHSFPASISRLLGQQLQPQKKKAPMEKPELPSRTTKSDPKDLQESSSEGDNIVLARSARAGNSQDQMPKDEREHMLSDDESDYTQNLKGARPSSQRRRNRQRAGVDSSTDDEDSEGAEVEQSNASSSEAEEAPWQGDSDSTAEADAEVASPNRCM